MELLEIVELSIIFLAGISGGLTSDILNDNCIELPKKIDGKLYLGWVGAMIIGGIAGVLIDGSPITAFMAGFTGKAIIERLLVKQEVIIKE